MQINELEFPHSNFYNPANGKLIPNEDMGYNNNAKSLIARWVDEVINDPFIKNNGLKLKWGNTSSLSNCEL